jgi:hypothetical protein
MLRAIPFRAQPPIKRTCYEHPYTLPGFVVAFAALPAHAQDLDARVAALENAVAKLNGQITADDLVGTYAIHVLESEMHAPSSPGGFPTQVSSYVTAGTVVLAADFTVTLNGTTSGNTLFFFPPDGPSLAPIDGSPNLTGNWMYTDGTLTISGGAPPLSVAAGGRVLIGTAADHDSGHDVLLILTRLQ